MVGEELLAAVVVEMDVVGDRVVDELSVKLSSNRTVIRVLLPHEAARVALVLDLVLTHRVAMFRRDSHATRMQRIYVNDII
jgi:hypothetical protein